MRKSLFVLPVVFLLLTSCSFPLYKTTPSSNEVATRVALTLQAVITETIPPQNPTILPTTPLGTITPTLTQTATVTSTTSPEDPRLSLGTPSFAEAFNSGSSFGLKTPYVDDAVSMSVANGTLLMTSLRANGGTRWRLTYPTPGNFYLEGTFKTVFCSGSDAYGLVFRAPSYTDGIGYYFGLKCNGQYSFVQWDGSSDKNVLINWTADSAILAGQDQTNRIGVMVKDNHFSLYINGKFIKDFTDDSLKKNGYFGVFLTAVENANFTVQVDEIDEWNQP